jgi:hypothetical protein
LRTASGFWRAPHAAGARLLTAVLMGGAVLQLVLQYWLNYWSRDFFGAFGRRDGSALWAQSLLFLLLVGVSILVAVLSNWARMTTQRRWRTWLTRHLIDRWLTNHRFRQLRFLQGENRNPEYPDRRGCVVPRQTRRSDGGLIAHSAAQRRHLRRHPVGCRRRSRRRDPWPRADRAKISGDHGGHLVANTMFKLVLMEARRRQLRDYLTIFRSGFNARQELRRPELKPTPPSDARTLVPTSVVLHGCTTLRLAGLPNQGAVE